MAKIKLNIYQYNTLLNSLELKPKCFINLAMNKKLNAIKHLPDKENVINTIWKKCAMVFIIMLKSKKIRSKTLSSIIRLKQNSWLDILDKLKILNLNDLNTLHISLFHMILQELILKEKNYKSFWTAEYNELSNKLLSPLEKEDVSLTCLNSSIKKEQLQSLTISNINIQNENNKTYYQLSDSTVLNNFVNESTNSKVMKILKVPIQLNQEQQNQIDEWINTSAYLYNKTLEKVNSGVKPNWMNLRDMLVTNYTKKNSNEYKHFDTKLKELREKQKELVKKLNKIILLDEKKIINDNINDIKKNIQNINQQRRDAVKKIKGEKNTYINEWELNTPKEVRTCAIKELCSAYTTGLSQFKSGNIKYFNLKYKKKTNNNKCVSIPKSLISIIDNKDIKIAPEFLKNDCIIKIGKRTIKKNKNIQINHDCKIIKRKNKYWILIPISVDVKEKKRPFNYCGVDPGVRTFMTTFSNTGCTEYKHNKDLLDKLNREIILLKHQRSKKIKYVKYNDIIIEDKLSYITKNIYKRIRKKAYVKREEKKINIIDELHWMTIQDLLIKNDIIFYGDIKSHDIVRNKHNRILNRSFNDMKFYKFKQRLIYKASVENKKVFCVNEAFTTQTCSFCGNMYKPECSKIYNCINCKNIIDRDINASKNILMKGIMTNLHIS